ncbi:MAG: S-layer homology domain-containing protein [Ruminococcus sp.]|nr:S-layer homology domain-containing protein [Ruminococcus sp.]MCM1381344.1 S-layer homology domain-containing protein [Muribaculaceae bacterium]MCM1480544.1 S-layer homology domain-containing protein [Muribaculaceae bacterium]
MVKMKKTNSIAKIAAAAMAVMLTAAAVPSAAYAANTASSPAKTSGGTSANTSSADSDAGMKAALTKVKQRVKVPEELKEFSYSTSESYGVKVYAFTWSSRRDLNSAGVKYIQVSIAGDVITRYECYDDNTAAGRWSNDPTLAKLTEEEILAKAKGYVKQLDPAAADKLEYKVNSLSLFGSRATVSVQRAENGITVDSNSGTVCIDKNTGELQSFSLSWWENADFPNPKTALSQEEIRESYKNLCKLTPYYRIETDWITGKKTARIVYEPSFNSELDAFTGEKSTVWDDMYSAGGTAYLDYAEPAEYDMETADTADESGNPATGAGGGVTFTEAELEKLQQNENLLTREQVFELLKKDKFAALTDDYEIKSSSVYSDKENTETPLYEEGEEPPAQEEEHYIMNIRFAAKDKNYKGYKNINVTLNAETGEIISLYKYGSTASLPKLDVGEAKAVAEAAANQYAKDIMTECYPDVDNDREEPTPVGGKHETSRRFRFNRFHDGIQVTGDYINVTVDSNGVVTDYHYNYTENVKFPSADILTSDNAFAKLYTQRNLNYYYTGWIGKDGSIHTYLVYEMPYFRLNAKTGKLCDYYGRPEETPNRGGDYTDIKGIPQEQAIITMQKYGVTVTDESKFEPNKLITPAEFSDLLNTALRAYYYDVADVDEPVAAEEEVYVVGSEEEKAANTVTRTEAAKMFTQRVDSGKTAELKGIFKTPFSDVKSTDENIGYIAIAYAKGFIPKGDGKFNGGKQLTRAEAMQMIYDYLVYISK